MSTPSRSLVGVTSRPKTSPTDSSTSGYSSNELEGLDVADTTSEKMPVLPQLSGDPECLAADMAHLIATNLVNSSVISVKAVASIKEKVEFELGDFEWTVGRVIGQGPTRLRSTESIPKMKEECVAVQLATHRVRMDSMSTGDGWYLSLFVYYAAEALYDIPNLVGGKYIIQDVEYYPHRFGRAMRLDKRLRHLLTQSRTGHLTEENVVSSVERILEVYTADQFDDVKQEWEDERSFDLSMYKDSMMDDDLYLLLQMAKYLDICACVSHLGILCYCHTKNEYHGNDGRGLETKRKTVTDSELEFVSWVEHGFPVSITNFTGQIREAKQRVFLALDPLIKEKKRLKVAISEGFHDVVLFVKDFTKVGWAFVPKEKLTIGLELERAYQELARVRASALAGISALDVAGILWNATAGLLDSYIADFDKKNLDGETAKLRCDRAGLWDFIFDSQEGRPLTIVLRGEYSLDRFEGLDFTADILRKKVSGTGIVVEETPIGLRVRDDDFTYGELNFLQAICKFFVVKLQIESVDQFFSI